MILAHICILQSYQRKLSTKYSNIIYHSGVTAGTSVHNGYHVNVYKVLYRVQRFDISYVSDVVHSTLAASPITLAAAAGMCITDSKA